MATDDPWGEFSVERYEAILQTRVVGYEFQAFETAYGRVGTVEGEFIAYDVLDACLVHARCCTEFLVARKKRKGQQRGKRGWFSEDVNPLDFVDSWYPEPDWAFDYLVR